MTGLGMDIRTAVRAMVRRPLFTLACVVTLAVGFGSITAILTVVDAVILRSLPYPESDRLVRVYTVEDKSDGALENVSGPDYLDWKAQSTSFDLIAGFRIRKFNITGAELPIRVRGASVTPEFFSVLGVKPALGRVLSPETDGPGAEQVVVVSDDLWRTQLGADPGIVGTSLRIDGLPYAVVGVTPAGFAYPTDAVLWASSPFLVPCPPSSFGDDPAVIRGISYFDVIGRLNEATDLVDAQSEMIAIADRLAKEYPDTNEGVGVVVQSLRDSVIGNARPRLLLFLAAAGLVLLISCVNVAGMLVARTTERLGEVGLRLAIGAERSRIVRQFLTESLVLAFAGGASGASLAGWSTKALLSVAPDALPRTGEMTVDPRVLVITLLVVIGTSILFGLAPATQALRQNIVPLINRNRGVTPTRQGRRLRTGLVVAEIAASLVLVVGTGLVVRTFISLNAVDPGFEPTGLLVAHVGLPETAYQDTHSIVQFQRGVLEKVRALPGVESATTVLTLPMHWNIWRYLGFVIEGRPETERDAPAARYQTVGTDYFRTMHIPLLRGRLFDEGDAEGALQVALVNRTAVERYWPDEDPIGKRLSWESSIAGHRDWVTIVGVVEDAHVDGLDEAPRPETYRPFAQDPFRYMTFVLRTSEDPSSFAALLRQAIIETDPDQPASGLTTMDEVLFGELAHRRFDMLLMGLFAGISVLLAAVGLYGMLSFNVSRRRHEIGIRRALGAVPQDIIVQIVSEGAKMIGFGLCVGAAGALLLVRFISTQLHGVSATDLPTYAASALLLVAVGLLASYLPARRAARVEPMTVLRTE